MGYKDYVCLGFVLHLIPLLGCFFLEPRVVVKRMTCSRGLRVWIVVFPARTGSRVKPPVHWRGIDLVRAGAYFLVPGIIREVHV